MNRRAAAAGRSLSAVALAAACSACAASAAFASVSVSAAASATAVAPLPVLHTDPAMSSVSGLSSGGYMAVQLLVAHSSRFSGAGVVAAGPYYCAQGQVVHAGGRCLFHDSPLPVAALQDQARQWAAADLIDPLYNLRAKRVHLFSGTLDSAVRTPVVADLARWLAPFVPSAQTRLRTDVAAEHGMVTDDFGNPCAERGGPYIQNCGVDLAGEILQHLLGPLRPRNDGAAAGRWIAFDQIDFVAAGRGMGTEGRLYVPEDCAQRPGCRLHVVLHGCGQNLDALGQTYVQRTGYPRWADTNRIVLLFPQTGRDAPHACWDWWGYTGADYAQRSAPQMRAIVAMVDRLAGIVARCHQALNAVHLWAGRARLVAWGALIAKGSGQWLGLPWATTSLREAPAGHYTVGACT